MADLGMPRDAHLAWARARALEYLDRGDFPNAVSSMTSDLGKHPAFCSLAYETLFAIGLMATRFGAEEVRHWIEGFK